MDSIDEVMLKVELTQASTTSQINRVNHRDSVVGELEYF